MPTYLDFESSRDGRTIPDIKTGFRDFLIAKTLQSPEGPQTFNQYFYTYKETSDYPNLDPGTVIEYITDTGIRTREDDLTQAKNNNAFSPEDYDVIENLNQFKSRELGTVESYITDTGTRTREVDLNAHKRLNTFKPEENYFIIEETNVYERKANLRLYPYFTQSNHNLIGIMTLDNYETESELMKFAAYNIKNNRQGPVFSRIAQNLETATVGKARFIDALQGNIGTAINIVTGKEPLIEYNYKITVAKTLLGKGVDFLQTVSGIEFPISEIPGDYLTNPKNPIENRPEAKTEFGKIFQDVTGALGSLIGIQRRPKLSRKPSDLFVEYMGQGQRQTLFDLLSYSTYAPNYTTTARSQQTSKTLNFVNNLAQKVNTALDLEAPEGRAYIGDDRGNDVIFAMGDLNDRPVRSPFYLSLMFDSVQAVLFQRSKNLDEGGSIPGELTWISKNSRNKLGANNNSYTDQSGRLDDSLSTKYEFRGDSILGYTQELLNTMPTDGGEARSHVANVIDQTSRIFREGDVYLSRGSAVKYVDNTGRENGIEYCRTWTKDRPYITYDDTMKKGMNIRKFEGSVMTDPWNLNIAPMSKNKSFEGSSNIFQAVQGNNESWYAKKYMFSIENLAWKTSNRPGFTVLDLPYCERGPNGGRIMWFPPYDLQINESNQAKWEENTFLGRPEPIYTYQNTSRSGQISFKVVVDHPSVLNLLVREEFKNMSDEDADDYINAFFAGCKDIDFYELIRKHSNISPSDLELVYQWLEDAAAGKGDPNDEGKVKKRLLGPTVVEYPGAEGEPRRIPTTVPGDPIDKTIDVRLNYDNDWPKPEYGTESSETYDQLYQKYLSKKKEYADDLYKYVPVLLNAGNVDSMRDTERLIGTKRATEPVNTVRDKQVAQSNKYFDELTTKYTNYKSELETLKQIISGKTIQNISLKIESTTSALTGQQYNRRLSLRRTHSVILDFFQKISKDGTVPKIDWVKEKDIKDKPIKETIDTKHTFTLKDFGWGEDYTQTVEIVTQNFGEESTGNTSNQVDTNCVDKEFPSLPLLSIVAPIAFYCRSTNVKVKYSATTEKTIETVEPTETKPRTETIWKEIPETVPPSPNKPTIDALKLIIMKTLAECYYFEMLEKDSPTAFKSLKDKLKYFHPAFHSMTPEGLNARLTFLQQCIRPGDTIPIKGIADDRDLTARNTTFGPPPICILRIGDFYNSKIVIRDINIKFDDKVWDMNPEGIGVQPMIADVSLQVSFIGGQGLEKPLERLQNALSSNFYANTEIYDPRAESTNQKIADMDAKKFTEQTLRDLVKANEEKKVNEKLEAESNELTKGLYISKLDGTTSLILTDLVKDVISKVDEYFGMFPETYNSFNMSYGPIITSLIFDQKYRDTKTYEIYTSSVPTTTNVELFGIPKKGFEIEMRLKKFKDLFLEKLSDSGTSISTIFEFNKELTPEKVVKSDELITEKILEIMEKMFKDIEDQHNKNIKNDFEIKRNNLITTLDKVNYLVKFGFDGKMVDNKSAKQATMSGFTSSTFYEEYSRYIDYIKENTPKMYEKIDTTVDFSYMEVNTSTISSILSVYLKDYVQDIMKLYKEDVSGQFTPKLITELEKRLNKFINIPKEVKIKFGKIKPRKNDKEIKYTFTESDLTNSTALSEIQLINKPSVGVTNNKLNYFKVLTKGT